MFMFMYVLNFGEAVMGSYVSLHPDIVLFQSVVSGHRS